MAFSGTGIKYLQNNVTYPENLPKSKSRLFVHRSPSSSAAAAARETADWLFPFPQKGNFPQHPQRCSRLVLMEMGRWSDFCDNECADPQLRYWDRFRKSTGVSDLTLIHILLMFMTAANRSLRAEKII